MIKRVILLVLDSVGVGELPDAANYHDQGSNTLGNIAKTTGGLFLPNLEKLGLGRIVDLKSNFCGQISGAYGKMQEASPGKDTTTGHWELAGLILDRPFPVYPDGFPAEIIKEFETKINRKTVGNKPASGTEIIQELGQKHVETGWPIIYTSADSVFQIAAHEEIIPLPELYRICQIAREILQGEHAVGRVIARPFVGKKEAFVRTPNRRDFSLSPPQVTLLDRLKEKKYQVIGIGKIEDIFAGRGLTKAIHIKNNADGMTQTLKSIEETINGKALIFVNLIDFDMIYGHRNDVSGYAQALQEVDSWLPQVFNLLTEEALLFITADHGCDPTTPSTDHSREYVPVLVWGKKIMAGINLGTRKTFADVGQTIADYLEIEALPNGRSFKKDLGA